MVPTSTAWPSSAELDDRFTDVRQLRTGTRFTLHEAVERVSRRRVVIKTATGAGTPWLNEILDHEARVLAAVGAHPHVVTLYERIAVEDGRTALVLEHCAGTLADAVRSDEDAMSAREVVTIGIQLAGALETLHAHGVLHCDVRPRTVLLSDWEQPVLAGFDESVDRDDLGTRPPMHNPTPHTAPELLTGSEPSPASDVYGLASTLYELAAGRAAFRAYVGESPASVIVRVLSSRAKPIVAPQVPLELSDVISWAMSPDPEERPPSPAWLAEELGRVEVRQDWPRTRFVTG